MTTFFAWESLWAVGLLAVAAGLFWGSMQYRRRARGNDKVSEEATKALWDNPDYESVEKPRLEREAERRQKESQ